MSLEHFIKQTEQFAKVNSGALLTGVGITGTVTTAYLAGRAGFKAAGVLRVREVELRELEEDGGQQLTTYKEMLRETWTLYIPAAGVGAVTVGSIVFANRLSSKKAAALAAAYGISEKAFTEYKEKVVERLGETKEKGVRDEIAQDRVTENPPEDKTIIVIAGGEVLCQDAQTGRYFMSSMETIKKAVNDTNNEIMNHGSASLSAFYDRISLPPTQHSNAVGWREIMDVCFSTAVTPDQRPCLVMDFERSPIDRYSDLY